MNPFLDKHCRDYSRKESALNLSQIEAFRQHTPRWQYCATEKVLCRRFHFDNFDQVMAFANLVAEISEQQDHHPDMHLSYKRCKVSFYTHTVNGLTENDFICAAIIDTRHDDTNV